MSEKTERERAAEALAALENEGRYTTLHVPDDASLDTWREAAEAANFAVMGIDRDSQLNQAPTWVLRLRRAEA